MQTVLYHVTYVQYLEAAVGMLYIYNQKYIGHRWQWSCTQGRFTMLQSLSGLKCTCGEPSVEDRRVTVPQTSLQNQMGIMVALSTKMAELVLPGG